MKQCIQCGGEYPDDLTACPLDGGNFFVEPRLPVAAPPPHHALDVSPIAAQVRRVRENYSAALPTQPRRRDNRTRLVEAFRRIVSHLAFFQSMGNNLSKKHEP